MNIASSNSNSNNNNNDSKSKKDGDDDESADIINAEHILLKIWLAKNKLDVRLFDVLRAKAVSGIKQLLHLKEDQEQEKDDGTDDGSTLLLALGRTIDWSTFDDNTNGESFAKAVRALKKESDAKPFAPYAPEPEPEPERIQQQSYSMGGSGFSNARGSSIMNNARNLFFYCLKERSDD